MSNTSPASLGLNKWHALVAARDATRLDALLARDVVFHSPVVHTPQVGKDITIKYLSAAVQVLMDESFHYVREVVQGDQAALEFVAERDGIQINGIDLITWNPAALITDFKVMVRPLKAINALHQLMGAELAKGS